MRGRKPKPGIQKSLEGNPGHRPLNDAEPRHRRLTIAFDTPPPELEGQPRAQAEWARLAPLLRQARQVTEADWAALLAVCLEWARYLEGLNQVTARGLVVETRNGYPMTNPYLAIATKALSNCTKLWAELGLTPSSRSRVQTVSDGETGDLFAEFDAAPALPTRPQ